VHDDLPPVSGELQVVESERRRQVAVGVDLLRLPVRVGVNLPCPRLIIGALERRAL
jgi:hypothetical protein